MKKYNFGYRKVGKVLVACAVAVATFGVANVASADTWVANSPESILIVPGQTTYELKLGDTLWAISQKINTTVENLAELNGIDLLAGEEKRLSVGRKIVLPGAGTSTVEKNQADEVISEGVVNTNLSTAKVNVVDATSSLSVEDLMERVESVEVVEGATHVKLKDGESMDDFVKDLEEVTKSLPVETPTEKPSQPVVETTVKPVEEVPVVPSEPLLPSEPTKPISDPPTAPVEPVKPDNEIPVEPVKPVEKKIVVYDGDDKITLINPKNKLSSNFVLIESDGKYGLFDAGTSGSQADYDMVTNYLKNVGVETLDFVFVSHLDGDHMSTLTSESGRESRLLYEDFKVNKLYIKSPEDTSSYRIAPPLNTTSDAFYNQNMKIYNDIVNRMNNAGAEIVNVKSNFSYEFGDFKIDVLNTASSKVDEQNNYWNNLDSMVQLVSKTDAEGNTYNMLVANDLEGYDIPEVISEVKALGVENIDVYELNHHGYSQTQAEGKMIANAFEVPVTVVTNTEESFAKNHPTVYKEVSETYTNGLYFQGEGSVQVDFSNTEQSGVIVRQENSIKQTVITRDESGERVIEQVEISEPVTETDLVTDKGNESFNTEAGLSFTSTENAEIGSVEVEVELSN